MVFLYCLFGTIGLLTDGTRYSLDKLSDQETLLAVAIAVALPARMRVGGTTPTAHTQLNQFYGDSSFTYQALQNQNKLSNKRAWGWAPQILRSKANNSLLRPFKCLLSNFTLKIQSSNFTNRNLEFKVHTAFGLWFPGQQSTKGIQQIAVAFECFFGKHMVRFNHKFNITAYGPDKP